MSEGKDLLQALKDHFDNLKPGELEKQLEEMKAESEKNKCTPDTCQGQCQGFGGCELCVEFRKEQGWDDESKHKAPKVDWFTEPTIVLPQLRWLNINEFAPEDGEKVLAYFEPFDSIEIYTYKDLEKTDEDFIGKHMFHNRTGYLTDDIVWWMPLPEKPKEN